MKSEFLQNLIKSHIKAQEWPRGAVRPPLFQAHRGIVEEGIFENTWQSLANAKKQGFEMSEIDVQLTRDHIPVLFHDESLLRMAGQDLKVRDLKLSEMRELFPVTTLMEALNRKDVTPFLNIELKTKIKFDEPLERKVSEVVSHLQAQSRVMFSSFNPFSIFRISRYLPQVPRALLVSKEDSPENHRALREMWFAPFLELHALHLEKSMVDAKEIASWAERKMPIAVWTLRGQGEIKKFQKMKLMSLITDSVPAEGP